MDVLGKAKEHFTQLQDEAMPYVEVPEWGEEKEPLKVYYKVMTLAQQDQIFKYVQEGSLKSLAQTLITRARKDDGSKMFRPANMTELMNLVDPKVIERICTGMAGDDPDEAEARKN